jgi:alpha-beta hydrolase superfamily lysophospholipase
MLAGHDRIIDNLKTKEMFATFGTGDRTVHEYPDAHHTLEFEPEGSSWFSDFLEWTNRLDPFTNCRQR